MKGILFIILAVIIFLGGLVSAYLWLGVWWAVIGIVPLSWSVVYLAKVMGKDLADKESGGEDLFGRIYDFLAR
ncbi:MAG: hypothetical protein AAF206_09710 [Bacteroidota bacterium]